MAVQGELETQGRYGKQRMLSDPTTLQKNTSGQKGTATPPHDCRGAAGRFS